MRDDALDRALNSIAHHPRNRYGEIETIVRAVDSAESEWNDRYARNVVRVLREYGVDVGSLDSVADTLARMDECFFVRICAEVL